MSDASRLIPVHFSTASPSWPWFRQTPNNDGVWENLSFSLDARKAAEWLVIYDDPAPFLKTSVPRERRILFIGEPPGIKTYLPAYLNQFGIVVSPYALPGFMGRLILQQSALPWHYGVDQGNTSAPESPLLWAALAKDKPKSKILSVICSNKVLLPHHRARLEFVKRLKQRLGDKVDVFGRGFFPVDDKAEAIDPYRYHIALENNLIDHFWTEKLGDTWLGDAYAIFGGCDNVSAYFDAAAYSRIDILDPDAAVDQIEKLIASDAWERARDSIRENRRRLMFEYNVFAVAAKIIRASEHKAQAERLIVPEEIKPFDRFGLRNKVHRLSMPVRSYASLLARRYGHKDVVRLLASKLSSYITHYVTLLTSPIYRSQQRWREDGGSEKLCSDYLLNLQSVVFVLGQTDEKWIEGIAQQYGAHIYVFEPSAAAFEYLSRRFASSSAITVHPYGLTGQTVDKKIDSVNGTSVDVLTQHYERRDVVEVLHSLRLSHVDLLVCDLDDNGRAVLERLVATGDIHKFDQIQIGLGSLVPQSQTHYHALTQRLGTSHGPTWRYPYVRENWRRKSPRIAVDETLQLKAGGTTVDVVIPLYNNELYVLEAINSVLGQSYPIQKVIVVDDGSTDRSAALVEDTYATDERVVLVRAPHHGRSAARNRGIEKSTADFVAFLDSDDIWLPTKLEKQMKLFADNPVIGGVYCGYAVIDEKGSPLCHATIIPPRLRGNVFSALLEANLLSGSASAIVVKRVVLEKSGLFDESFAFAEDWDLWLRLARICEFDFDEEALVFIRSPSCRLTQRLSYFKRMYRLIQHIRVWSKWPDDVLANEIVLQEIRVGILRLYLRPFLSRRRYAALSRVITQRVLVHIHPRIAVVLKGPRWSLPMREMVMAVIVLARYALRNARPFLVRRMPWLRPLKRKICMALGVG